MSRSGTVILSTTDLEPDVELESRDSSDGKAYNDWNFLGPNDNSKNKQQQEESWA